MHSRKTAVPAPPGDQMPGANLLKFTVLPYTQQASKPKLIELDFDLLLMTHLEGMGMPVDLRDIDAELNGEIKRRIEETGFTGKAGQKIEFELPAMSGGGKRRLLLLGIGEAGQYCGRAAGNTFKHFVDHALTLGAVRIAIPFMARRATRDCLKLNRTASILATTIRTALAEHGKKAPLSEVHIVCTPQAKSRISEGLRLSQSQAASCGCHNEQ